MWPQCSVLFGADLLERKVSEPPIIVRRERLRCELMLFSGAILHLTFRRRLGVEVPLNVRHQRRLLSCRC